MTVYQFPNYEVSLDGRVRNKSKGLVLNGYFDKDGYLNVNLRNSLLGTRKVFKIHRLVALAFIPNLQSKPLVNHINGIKTDNHIYNLEWVTASENNQHAHDNGLINTSKGENHWNSKLSVEDIKEIKNLYKFGLTQKLISEIFHVGSQHISRIVRNETWTHL